MTRHYLDHNATAPVRPEVIETVAKVMALPGNASSVHGEGRAVRAVVEEAREKVRRLVNAPVNGVIFTSGGTEAIHYALNGLVAKGAIKRIFVSAIEHVALPTNADATGVEVETIPATKDGVVDLDWLKARLDNYDTEKDGGFLVCVMVANNETGVIQPVTEAADITHAAGGLLFADGAQAVGKIPVNFVMLGADLMSLTGHKFGGPLGVGALIVSPNLPLEPVMRGGGHEMNRRAGTTNAPAIAGLGKACDLAADSLARASDIAAMRDKVEAAVLAEGAKVWGANAARLPGTLSFSAPGFTGETQVMAMDLANVAVSSGSACSSGKVTPSHVLSAMGVSEEEAVSSLRVSLGWNSTAEDVEAFINAWTEAYKRVKARAA